MRFFAEYLSFHDSVCFDVLGIGGVASAAGSVASGAMQAAAANHAADLQSAAANRAMDMQLQQYNQTQNNLAPYRANGEGAAFKLANLFGLVSQQQQNGGGGASVPVSASSGGSATGQPAAGWQVQPFGGVQGDGSYEHVITDPNGTQYYVAYNKDGSLNSAYDAGGNQITGLQLATLTSAISNADVPGAAAPGVSSGGGSGAGGGLTELGSGSPDMNVLAPFGINSLTYNPEAYGLGNGTFNPAAYGLGNGTFQPTEQQLESMPGYQFTLDQGLKSAQNGYAARGLGSSGAAMKGAAQYATGLADQTVNTEANIFNQNLANARNIYQGNLQNTQGIFQSNLGNVLNPLMQIAGNGQGAAISGGQIGAQGINSAANSLIGGANASAAGLVGGANAIGSGLNNGINNYMQYNMMNKLLQNANGGNVYEDTSTPMGSQYA